MKLDYSPAATEVASVCRELRATEALALETFYSFVGLSVFVSPGANLKRQHISE